jgi:hypothetical protein
MAGSARLGSAVKMPLAPSGMLAGSAGRKGVREEKGATPRLGRRSVGIGRAPLQEHFRLRKQLGGSIFDA